MESDGDSSPLSDLDLDEQDEPEKITKPTKHVFKLSKTLKTPRATTYAAQSLHEQISRGDIDLNPEYQRDVVWPSHKQTSLIESLFRNCYVPPVIFSVQTTEDGSEARVCIDGKQRLTSIHLFMSGQIPFRDPYTGQQLWYEKGPDSTAKKGELLPEKYRATFCNKQIVCVEYEDLKEADERDIFKRVQLGVALSNAEKLQAISTPRADFVRYLIKTFITATTLCHPDVAWDHSRGRDFKMFVIVIYVTAKWNKKTGLVASIHHDPLKTWLAEGGAAPGKYLKGGRRDHGEGVPVPEGYKKEIIKTCETVATLATTRKYNFPFRSSSQIRPSISMLEVAGAFILVYVVYVSPPRSSNGKVSLQTLSSLFTLLRVEMLSEHEDLRANSVTGRTLVKICLEMSRDPMGYLREGRNELDKLTGGRDVVEGSDIPRKKKQTT